MRFRYFFAVPSIAVMAACSSAPTTTDTGAVSDAGQTAHDAGHDSGASVADSGVSDTGAAPMMDAQSVPGGYHTVGNQILDATNKPHLFHGVDQPSFEWSTQGDPSLPASNYANMAAWKANVVRIALNQDFWLAGSASYSGQYKFVIDRQIKAAEAAGLDVILDLHWSDTGNLQIAKAAQQKMADANSLTFWTQVATRYMGDPRVLFELYNEPHDVSWDIWLKGGALSDGWTAVGMQQLYNAVRATGAKNLVLVGGLSYAYDLSEVPSVPVVGYNIIYATHPYNTGDKQPGDWDHAFGTLSATVPVMATEFGNAPSMPDCTTTYPSNVIKYADAHHMSWSAWAWFPSGCGFPSIVSDWNGTPTQVGAVVKAALMSY